MHFQRERLLTTAVITGAASGIGKATALRFAKEGYVLAVLDANERGLDAAARELEKAGAAHVLPLHCDQRSFADVADAFTSIKRAFDTLDVAVNCAGVLGAQARAGDTDEANWMTVIDVNLNGTWRCLHHELKLMQAQDVGAICNVGSIWGIAGGRENPAYVAAKHGIIGLTRAAALDYARSGIRINTVCPGTIQTEMVEAWLAGNEGFRERTLDLKPMGRLGLPEEIANAIFWICSPEAGFVQGSAFVVDGAETVGPPAASR